MNPRPVGNYLILGNPSGNRKALTKNGKIMLLGCSMGHNHYAQNVSKVTGKVIFASDSSFGAANEQTVLKHDQNIDILNSCSPTRVRQRTSGAASHAA
jgi:hypothetical protein